MDQFRVDMGSRLSMSLNGWSYPMRRGDMFLTALLTRVINVTRGKDEKPFVPDWPWPDEPKADDVTPDERAALVTSLKSRSAFGQKRTET